MVLPVLVHNSANRHSTSIPAELHLIIALQANFVKHEAFGSVFSLFCTKKFFAFVILFLIFTFYASKTVIKQGFLDDFLLKSTLQNTQKQPSFAHFTEKNGKRFLKEKNS